MPWYKRFSDWLMHHVDMWRIAWREENRRKRAAPLRNNELEFLPAIVEIQETPPSPVGRAIGMTVITLFVLAVIWAIFGHIDIVASAQGKVIPSSRTKVIQPLETSVIKAIHVTEGQLVKQGDLLVELDPTESDADVMRLSNELTSAKLDYAGYSAIADKLDDHDASLLLTDYVNDLPPDAILMHQQITESQLAAYYSKRMALENAILKFRSELKSMQLSLAQIKKTLPLIEKRTQSYRKATIKGVVAENHFLELEQQRIEKEQELIITQERIVEYKATIDEARDQQATLDAEFKQGIYTEMRNAKQLSISLENELRKAQQRKHQTALYAPVSGKVQQLSVYTVSGIVTPAQELMKIVPADSTLEIEAWVENKDIGFVYPEQTAEIKVESFPFTKYGTIDGIVLNMSDDAVEHEQLGFFYRARVGMAKHAIQAGEKLVNLSPGMNVTVEIKTGKRRVIEYFLTPVLRGFDESVRER